MNTFFDNNFYNVCGNIGLLNLSLLVTDLKLPSLKNDLNDFLFGFVGEKLVEVCLFGCGSM
jgi:hypothetical protein